MPAVHEQRSRRIVVVFGGEGDAGVASVLDSLMAVRRGDVAGVFIEDQSLFRTAELPFATEVCRVTAVRRPLTTAVLERQMSALALHAEQAVRRVAERAGSPWSFRRHRGRLSTALANAPDVDFVVVGAVRRALAPAGELRATAQTVRAVEAEARKPVAVLYERSGPGGRALDVGVELAERTGRSLVVFLPASLAAALSDLEQRLRPLGPQRAIVRTVPSTEPAMLSSALRRASPAVLVVGGDEAGVGEDRLGDLQREVRCPLVEVR
jgi:hypothetical protein